MSFDFDQTDLAFWAFLVLFPLIFYALIGWLRLKATNPETTEEAGVAIMPRATAWIMRVFFIALAPGGIALTVSAPYMWWVGVPTSAMGLYFIWSLSEAQLKAQSVIWTADEITGPRRLFLIPFAENRTTIQWSEVSELQNLGEGVFALVHKHGKKVFWSDYYAGADVLESVVRKRLGH